MSTQIQQPEPFPATTPADVESDFRKVSGVERDWKPGEPSSPEKYHERFLKRFWSKVDKTPGLGPWGNCWEWRGSITNRGSDGRGYGQIGYRERDGNSQRPIRTHVASWTIVHGHPPVPKGWHVCHDCNNKPCVREDHLFPGTPLQNTHHAQATGLMPKVDYALRAHLKHQEQEKKDALARIVREFIDRHLHLISTPRTKEILRMRYGYTHSTSQTLDEVGAHFRVTRERVRQIQALAEEGIRMYTIEKDVPLPGGNKPNSLTDVRDTLIGMSVGDSFVMSRDNSVKVSTVAKTLGFLVTTRKISDTEMRVWMVNRPKADKAA